MGYEYLSNLIIKKILSVATIYSETGTKNRRENRNCWAIIHKFEGETVYYSMGKSYVSNYNNMVILPKGCSYEWQSIKSGHFSVIEFECDKVFSEIFYFTDVAAEAIHKSIEKMERHRIHKEPFYELECVKGAYAVILRLLSTGKKKYIPSQKVKKLEAAINFIAENYTQPVTNDQLAELCGISTVYFRKLFTEVYGISPIKYIHKLKIKKANEMLRTDYSSITDIAMTLGYSSIYDFSRDFKRYTGISPREYVRTTREDKTTP